MSDINKEIVDQSKYIVDVALKLRNLDLEIAKNPNCYELKSRRFKVLQDLHEKLVEKWCKLQPSSVDLGIRIYVLIA